MKNIAKHTITDSAEALAAITNLITADAVKKVFFKYLPEYETCEIKWDALGEKFIDQYNKIAFPSHRLDVNYFDPVEVTRHVKRLFDAEYLLWVAATARLPQKPRGAK